MVFYLVIIVEVACLTTLVALMARFGRKKIDRTQKINTKVESRDDKELKMFH